MEYLENAYIYGIFINDKLEYIGKTNRPVQERIDEHLRNCHNEELKKKLKENEHWTFKIYHETHNKITERELEILEENLINIFQPPCNILGTKLPYLYSEAFGKQKTRADVLNSRKYYCEEDLEIIFNLNPCIKHITPIRKYEDEYVQKFFSSKYKYQKYLENLYGKTNKFNTCDNYTKNGFLMNSYCVKMEDKNDVRAPKSEEKETKNIKNGKLKSCILLFEFFTLDEYLENFKPLEVTEENLEHAMCYNELIFRGLQMIKTGKFVFNPLKYCMCEDEIYYQATPDSWLHDLED